MKIEAYLSEREVLLLLKRPAVRMSSRLEAWRMFPAQSVDRCDDTTASEWPFSTSIKIILLKELLEVRTGTETFYASFLLRLSLIGLRETYKPCLAHAVKNKLCFFKPHFPSIFVATTLVKVSFCCDTS